MTATTARQIDPATGRCEHCAYWRPAYLDFGDCLERNNRDVEFSLQSESYKRNLMRHREDGSCGLDEFLPLRAADYSCQHYQEKEGGER